MRMKSLKEITREYLVDDCGATAIEYAMIATSTTILIVAPLIGIGDYLETTWGKIVHVFDWSN